MNHRVKGAVSVFTVVFLILIVSLLSTVLILQNRYSNMLLSSQKYLIDKNNMYVCLSNIINDEEKMKSINRYISGNKIYKEEINGNINLKVTRNKAKYYEYVDTFEFINTNGLSAIHNIRRRQFSIFSPKGTLLPIGKSKAYFDNKSIPENVLKRLNDFYENGDICNISDEYYIIGSDTDINLYKDKIMVSDDTGDSVPAVPYFYNNFTQNKIRIYGTNSWGNPIFVVTNGDIYIESDNDVYFVIITNAKIYKRNTESKLLGVVYDINGLNKNLEKGIKSKEFTYLHMNNPIILDTRAYTIYK